MICSEQIESFKANGYLVMPGFIDSEQIEEWRDQFWSHLGCTLAEPEKWPEKVTDFEPDPIFGNMPELQSIARQVGGGHFRGGGCGVAVRWPQQDQEWAMPESGHLDGYPGEGCQAVLLIGATTYLDDSQPGGGNYVYWPASHHLAHRYFRQYPDRIEGTFRETPEWDERGWVSSLMTDRSQRANLSPRLETLSCGTVGYVTLVRAILVRCRELVFLRVGRTRTMLWSARGYRKIRGIIGRFRLDRRWPCNSKSVKLG